MAAAAGTRRLRPLPPARASPLCQVGCCLGAFKGCASALAAGCLQGLCIYTGCWWRFCFGASARVCSSRLAFGAAGLDWSWVLSFSPLFGQALPAPPLCLPARCEPHLPPRPRTRQHQLGGTVEHVGAGARVAQQPQSAGSRAASVALHVAPAAVHRGGVLRMIQPTRTPPIKWLCTTNTSARPQQLSATDTTISSGLPPLPMPSSDLPLAPCPALQRILRGLAVIPFLVFWCASGEWLWYTHEPVAAHCRRWTLEHDCRCRCRWLNFHGGFHLRCAACSMGLICGVLLICRMVFPIGVLTGVMTNLNTAVCSGSSGGLGRDGLLGRKKGRISI